VAIFLAKEIGLATGYVASAIEYTVSKAGFRVPLACRQCGLGVKEFGGTMPEDLPAAESIKKLESLQRKKLRKQEPGERE